MGNADQEIFASMTEEELRTVLKMMQEDRSPQIVLLWEIDYRERPVDIWTFMTDPYYLGMTVGKADDFDIYQEWANVLGEVFNPNAKVWEFILSGSIGTGKTTIAALAMVYKLYHLSCLRSPQRYYGLMPDHPIVFGLYNVFKYKVQTTSFAYVEAYVNSSPYFREQFPRNPRKSASLEFPHNIRVLHGASDLHALGENLFGVLIDETDFMKAGATDDDKGQAYKLYVSTVRRMESRFMRKGGEIPGILIMISSKTSKGSFIEQRIEDRSSDERTVIADKTLWDVKPWRYGESRFPIYIGDQYHDPKMLSVEDGEKPEYSGKVIWVPDEHRLAFEEDLEGALRDIAGVATVTEMPFIPSREDIHACVDPARKHPFTKEEFSVTIHNQAKIEDFFDHKSILKVQRSQFSPKVRHGVKRYIHIDLGVTGDSLGFAMGHISGFKEVTRPVLDPAAEGFEYSTRAPLIYIDLMFRVTPTVGSRIDFQKIRDFVYALRDYGYPIAHISLDGFQSEDSMQQFIKMGFESTILSLDRLPKEKEGHPYSYLRQAILEHRISYYHYPIFLAEVIALQRTMLATTAANNPQNRWKVDHPPQMLDLAGNKVKGSKDVADAVGGVVRQCMVLDPASQAQGLPVKGSPRPRPVPAGAVRPAAFLKDDQWVVGDDYDALDRIEGIVP